MKRVIAISLFIAFWMAACNKTEAEKPEPGPMPVTNMVKTGDWMVTYMENNVMVDVGLIFLKFDASGTLVATKNGAYYNGTWTEANTAGNNTLSLSISATDAKMQKLNKKWGVTDVSEYIINLKDPDANHVTVQLMKH